MLAFTNAKEKQSPTIIGAGCKLTGDMKTDHTVQIHGQVIGNITADTVVIGRGGRVVGKIVATNLFLHGTLDGPATVNTANVFSNAQMTGTLSYFTLNITSNTGLECKLSKRKDKRNE
ncbi:MAG: polymer-forming cytoskeletal protein [Proteobacteria bacterium]|uniref:Polymer-forming cytoskeletal protein n=1 Tax=Candidatus Enterousia avistercoris TaxID=2840788 RepID=A0A9D9GVL1_9PROT|nr:polymer-forming cytoskeletal protein [Candidatus Enterousia avistercoris]